VGGGLADLKTLYAAEPSGLFWFTGEKPHPALEPALDAIAHCDGVGLVPADYDAAMLSQKGSAMKMAGANTSPADRALFDIAVTVSAGRLLQAVHWGRVDPRNVGYDYDVTSERLDLAAEPDPRRRSQPARRPDAAGPGSVTSAWSKGSLYRALAAIGAARRSGSGGTDGDRAGKILVSVQPSRRDWRLRRPARAPPRQDRCRRTPVCRALVDAVSSSSGVHSRPDGVTDQL
jgi:hypothetical protein